MPYSNSPFIWKHPILHVSRLLQVLQILIATLVYVFTCTNVALADNNLTPSSPLLVTHKLPELGSSERSLHEVEVLRLALDKTIAEFGPYELRGIPPMNRARTLVSLSHNLYPNLVLQMSYEDELPEKQNLSYIPFPLDLGAFSYRVCFARDELQNRKKPIRQFNDLKNYTFGSGIGWSDSKILRANGLNVVESNSVISLFRMTKAGRVDFFCRAPMEMAFEQQFQGNLGLTADQEIALYYPLPKFFFTHKDNKALLARIQKGLEIAYADGSFHQLWRSRHGKGIEQAKLNQRRIFKLSNPLVKNLPHNYEIYLHDPLSPE